MDISFHVIKPVITFAAQYIGETYVNVFVGFLVLLFVMWVVALVQGCSRWLFIVPTATICAYLAYLYSEGSFDNTKLNLYVMQKAYRLFKM